MQRSSREADPTIAIGETHETPDYLSREDVAKIELGHTAIGRWQVWALVVGFALSIIAVPVWQHVHDFRENAQRWQATPEARRQWTQLLPQVYDIVELAPAWDEIYRARSWWGAFRALPSADQITAYETAVEENSALAALMLPRVQWLLSALGRTGNEQAVTGRAGWLFYKPDMAYVTGPAFADPDRLRQIRRYTDIEPDPLPAIVTLAEQLAARGIALIVMPTPVKPQVHPEMMTGRYAADAPLLNNPSYDRFVERLRGAGVAVFDPAPLIRQLKLDRGEAMYLATDTHWQPQAMEAVAAALARRTRDVADLPPPQPDRFERASRRIAHVGDVTVMLKLPEEQTLWPDQAVTVHPVKLDGQAWSPRVDAPVLLLGDSFTNIYATEDLGWGRHAGLAEQLSHAFGLPVARIPINARRPHASRAALADALVGHYRAFERTGRTPGRERLADKKVVIYQFANRELLSGDWRRIDLPEARPEAFGSIPDAPGDDATTTVARVRGRIEAISRPPRPNTVPYKDAIIAVHLTDVQVLSGRLGDDTEGDELLVYTLGMQDNRWTPAADWDAGRTMTLNLQPWADVEERFGSIQRRDLGTDADLLYPVWWTRAAGEETRDR